MLQKGTIRLLSAILFLTLLSAGPTARIDVISMKLSVKTLSDGQSVHVNGTLYYDMRSGLMVTQYDKPLQTITMTNSKGELKVYDPVKNQVMLAQASGFRSDMSYFYYFLTGRNGDMGLPDEGYRMVNSKFDNGMLITTWDGPRTTPVPLQAELVIKDFNPLFLGIKTGVNKYKSKTYYSSYSKLNEISFPYRVTEINFQTATDSMITKKEVSDIRINEQVDKTWLNFQIPSDAKVVVK